MSLYIGGDSNILHITKGHQDITSLRNGVINETVFHSSLNYLTVTRYTATIASGIMTVSSALKTIMSSYVYIIVDSAGTFIPPLYEYMSNSNFGWYWNYGMWSGLNMNLLNAANGVCSVYVFSATQTTFLPAVKTGDYITIGNSVFNIKGVDLLGQSYVSRGVLNDIDPTFSIASVPFQITNMNFTQSDTLAIISNSTSSYISRGGKKIIDSALGNNMEYVKTGTAYVPYTRGLGLSKYNNVSYFTPFGLTVSDKAFVAISMRNPTIYGDYDGYGTAIVPINMGKIKVVRVATASTYTSFDHQIFVSTSTTGITIRSYFQSNANFVGYNAYYHLFGV